MSGNVGSRVIKLTALPSGQRSTCPLQILVNSGRVIGCTEFDLLEISAKSFADANAHQLSKINAAASTRRTTPPILRLIFVEVTHPLNERNRNVPAQIIREAICRDVASYVSTESG